MQNKTGRSGAIGSVFVYKDMRPGFNPQDRHLQQKEIP